jgi:hypothetical protein
VCGDGLTAVKIEFLFSGGQPSSDQSLYLMNMIYGIVEMDCDDTKFCIRHSCFIVQTRDCQIPTQPPPTHRQQREPVKERGGMLLTGSFIHLYVYVIMD